MSRAGRRSTYPRARFPRVSGDEPNAARKYADLAVFSPRERG